MEDLYVEEQSLSRYQ